VDKEIERNWKDMALRFCNGFPLRLYLGFLIIPYLPECKIRICNSSSKKWHVTLKLQTKLTMSCADAL